MNRLFAALAVLSVLSMPALADPVITFEEQAVVAQVTPGATTAWFSVVHEWHGYRLKITDHAEILVDDDNDGIVRKELNGPTKRNAVWMVADLDSGDYSFAVPEGCTLQRDTLPSSAISIGTRGASSSLTVDDESVIVWLIRPGTGAWYVPADDGANSDVDSFSDGSVTASSGLLQPVGEVMVPNLNFAENDILVAIDPVTLKVLDMRVAQ
ncbi:MAG: hypothetical protein ACTHQM_25625 [Thermoanaerobaculia bacterium]